MSKSQLILIGGEAWTGKTTCARVLFERLDNAAWLDGDDVWRVNPWSLDDPRLRTSDINMAFVIQTYLQSEFDYVILSSIVLSDPAITARILERISGVEYDLLSFTLMGDDVDRTCKAKRWARQPYFCCVGKRQERSATPSKLIRSIKRRPALLLKCSL